MTVMPAASTTGATTPAAVPVAAAPGGVTTVVNPIRPPTASEQTVIDAAEAQRTSALSAALVKVNALLARCPAGDSDGESGAPSFTADEQTDVDKVMKWLCLSSTTSQFWQCLQSFRDLITKNQGLGTLTQSVDTVTVDHAYVYAYDTARGIFFCSQVYFGDNANCQREVIVHEYFHHIVGPQHYYVTQLTDEAMKCPHHLAELVFDLATGCTLGCVAGSICR